jgi:hypothetical protein
MPSAPGTELPAPERTLVAKFAIDDVAFTVASLYTVTGDVRSPTWGPQAKRETHRTWATWLSEQAERTVVGVDANSPKVDHPDEMQNVYWGEEYGFDYQGERLLFDRRHAPHVLRDVYRRFVEASSLRLQQARSERPNGPLAVSHVNLGRERRYDFLLTTPDIEIYEASYRSDLIAPGSPSRLSDHAPVVATLGVPPTGLTRALPVDSFTRAIRMTATVRVPSDRAQALVLVWQMNPRPAVVHFNGACRSLSRSLIPDRSVQFLGPKTVGWLPLEEARKLLGVTLCRHCM